MKNILLLLSFMIIGCKDTGVHIIDNPDGTSVKVSYWGGNNKDNQPNIIQVGNRGKYMKVSLKYLRKFECQIHEKNVDMRRAFQWVLDCKNRR